MKNIFKTTVKKILRRDRLVENFFRLSYPDRVAVIKEIFSHEKMKSRLRDYFDEDFSHQTNSQHFFDYVAGYSLAMNASCLQQIGCFGATESKFAIDAGFSGSILATDYDESRLEFLRNEYKGSPYSSIKFAHQDLESPHVADFYEADLVVAQAVLSNIQPETILSLFESMAATSIRCILIGDIYDKASLTLDATSIKSFRSPNDRNWYHPFMALGRRVGYEAFFLPDFMYSSFLVARGIVVLHRNLNLDTHKSAAALAMERYISRQEDLWNFYDEVNINKPWRRGKRWSQ